MEQRFAGKQRQGQLVLLAIGARRLDRVAAGAEFLACGRSTVESQPLAAVQEALERRFAPLVAEPTPYLAVEAGHPEHEPEELEAIAAGELSPTGIRLAYERR